MLQAGARQSAVARELNVHRSVIHKLWNHYQREQNASRRRGSGCGRITTTADDRYLLQCARRVHMSTLWKIRKTRFSVEKLQSFLLYMTIYEY
ncbi:hypothetical protein AVEN_221309-1 [Araneus ventricosus]|uniref:Transposase Tc1-like domain-containing protein n=1 Tax=Araneus ventricosus TaxID=182803 RepID=A0A4Y2B0X0_ARAVE|nr:hypothetical protein AVEN_221309-1 [Araneus ventricosus]